MEKPVTSNARYTVHSCAYQAIKRISRGKVQRERAWQAFQQVMKDVVVGIARKSIEAWVLACWDPDEEENRQALAWVKQERGTEFNPFREPDRLTPNLGKKLLEFFDCMHSGDYADVAAMAADNQLQSNPAERAGLSQFVAQIETKLSHLVEAETDQTVAN